MHKLSSINRNNIRQFLLNLAFKIPIIILSIKREDISCQNVNFI